MSRVCIIGLDCLTPQLVFETFSDHLPNFKRLIERGRWGTLRSVDPPITVPAWASMMTGQSPGELGIYGFRDRKKYDYSSKRIASSMSVRAPTLWDAASRANLDVCVIGVPLTYPAKPIRGKMITGPMTPDDRRGVASYPPELLDALESSTGKFQFDIQDFRHRPKPELLEELYQLSHQRFDLTETWLENEPWDLMVMVDMAPDRLHHIFWGDMVDGAKPTDSVIFQFYQHLDQRLGQLTEKLQADDILLIVSDHGAQTMKGGVAINQWLIERGYLTLNQPVAAGTKLTEDIVDWSSTRVWGSGGYAGRLFFNVSDREPKGIVAPEDVDELREELADALQSLCKLDGLPMPIEFINPREHWKNPRGMPPDAMLYLDELRYRVLGTVGWENHLQHDNDIGRDGANHQHDGVIIETGGANVRAGGRHDQSLLDVYPKVMGWLGLEN